MTSATSTNGALTLGFASETSSSPAAARSRTQPGGRSRSNRSAANNRQNVDRRLPVAYRRACGIGRQRNERDRHALERRRHRFRTATTTIRERHQRDDQVTTIDVASGQP
jgi:hypothetical protein